MIPFDLLTWCHDIRSKVGVAIVGERVIIRGKDLHLDLLKHSPLSTALFAASGRLLTPQEDKLIQAMCTATSYPDARIWCNRVVALAGSTRVQPALALAGLLALSPAEIYGALPRTRGTEMLCKAKQHCDGGGLLEDFVEVLFAQKCRIPGYGRPIQAGQDERNRHILAYARELGFTELPHVELTYALERLFRRRYDQLWATYGAIVSALWLDLGFTKLECNLLESAIFMYGAFGCYAESLERPELAFLPIPVEDVLYSGPPPRKLRKRK